jgi:hypothetical protein
VFTDHSGFTSTSGTPPCSVFADPDDIVDDSLAIRSASSRSAGVQCRSSVPEFSAGVQCRSSGVVVGRIASLALARVLSSVLFATSARDPLIFSVVPAVLVAVAALASMAPATRAARVDPVTALRSE